jgi:hypothetical protein
VGEGSTRGRTRSGLHGEREELEGAPRRDEGVVAAPI